MNLDVQKRLAADVLDCSKYRIKFDQSRIGEIKEAITKADIRALVQEKAIKVKQKKGISKARTRKRKQQKKKGLRSGHGSRKGTANARLKDKRKWINKIRLQRKYLKELKEKEYISSGIFRKLYLKSKGGFFRSKRHIKLYLNERGLLKK